jgi:hypothetical protein
VTSYSPTTPSFLTFTCSGSEMQVLEAWWCSASLRHMRHKCD